MSYKSLSEHLLESPELKPTEPVNEVFLTLIAASVLAFTCKPLLDTDFMKSIGGGIGMMFGGIGSMFGLGAKKDKDDKDDKDSKNKSKKDKEDKEDNEDKKNKKPEDDPKNGNDSNNQTPKNDNSESGKKKPTEEEMMLGALMVSTKKLEETRDEAKKAYEKDPSKKNKEALENAERSYQVFMTSAFNEDGTPKKREDILKGLKDATGVSSGEELSRRLGCDQITAEDYEKTMRSVSESFVDSDGNVDEEKVKAAHADLKNKAKAAHEARKKAEEDAKAEEDRKKKEAETKAERDKNRENDKKNEKPEDNHDKDTDSKKSNRLKDIEDKWTKASEEVEELEKKLNDASDDEKKDLEKQLDKKKKLVANLEKAQKKLDDNSEKEYVVKHEGKETTIIKRPKKRGEGSTWCYKNDPDTTISPDQARAMLKASGVKEGLTLAEWLAIFLD